MPTMRQHVMILLCGLVPALVAVAEPVLTLPSPLDLAYLEQQQQRVDALVARRLGRRLGGDETDIESLQAILDRQLVKADDEPGLQALGIVLGNILSREYDLQWVIYSDSKGRSRALQVREAQCLFPATMIARRARAGLAVDVRAIYDKAVQTIEKVRAAAIRPY
jgi:hypothetical protein